MSEHLPECPSAGPVFMSDRPKGPRPCICPALEACQRRVLTAAREAVAALPANQRRSNEDGAGGYIQHADGMGTSVNRSETFTEYLTRAAALAAIDALKGESNG